MFCEPNCIKIKALGRVFDTGTLYNYAEDAIITNISLWDDRVVSSFVIHNEQKEKRIKVYNTMATDYCDDDEDKHPEPSISDLEIDDHSAMSLTAGLVRPPPGRAWKYAVDRANFEVGPFCCDSHVAVYIRCSSKNKSIDPTTSQLSIICTPDALIQSKATHVVVAVTYGLEAFCIFSRHNRLIVPQNQESIDEMTEFARLFADSVLTSDASGLDERIVIPELRCILYSDLIDDGRNWMSQSVVEQFAACRRIMGNQSSKAIPLEVWLYPLDKLKEIRTSFKRITSNQKDISPYLMVRCQLLWGRLQRVRVECDSLISELGNNIQHCNLMQDLHQRTQQFRNSVNSFMEKLLNALSQWTISIRRGKELNEDRMVEMTETIDNESPFDSNKLIRWIKYHKEQIRTLKTLKNLPGVGRLSGTKQVLDEEIQNASYDWYAVVLHLPNLTGQPDRLVQDMNLYGESFQANLPPSWTGMKWTEKPTLDYRPLLKAGQQFSDWVTNYNSATTSNVFYLIFYDEDRDGRNPFMRLYRCGFPDESMAINIPKAPGKVDITVENNRRGDITLSWEIEETHIWSGYLFQYLDVNRSNDPWTSFKVEQNEITINFLQPEETYVFRVATETLAGRSPFGPVSEEITIDPVCSPPTNVETKLTSDSVIALTWDHDVEDCHERFRITSYSVDCWVDGQEDSTLIQRTTTSNKVTIEPLDRGTVYCIQIRAVCRDTTGSTFDGPSCPVLKVETERDAERLAQIVQRTSRKNSQVKSGIAIYNLTLRRPQGKSTPGLDHYVFGELTHLALAGKRRQRTILMVGATGSGKTTLINAMVNYVLGVKWEDDFRFNLVDEPTNKSQAHSQTESVTTYDLYHMEGSRLEYSLTVVDTPGFGDTSGIEKDKKIYDQIKDYFKGHQGIRQLEAVCFVVQASEARLTKTQRYIFDSILSIFGNDIEDNIRLMVTFAHNGIPPVLAAIKEACIPSPVDPNTKLIPLHHKFNSSYFFIDNKEDDMNEINRTCFDMSVESFDCFFQDLSYMKTKSLARTTEVLEERMRLQLLVECFRMRMKMKMTRANELENLKKVLADNREQMESNADFQFDVKIHVAKSIDIWVGTGKFTTNCENCKITCHFPCRQGDDKDKNKCSVMDPNGHCRICNCHWSGHCNQNYRYKWVKEIKRHSLDSIRELYQGTADETLSNEKLVEKIQKEIDDDEKQLLDLMQATSPHIQRLDEIALRPHPMSTLSYIDLMIEKERKKNRLDITDRISKLKKLRKMAKSLNEILTSVEENKMSPQGLKPLCHRISADWIDEELELKEGINRQDSASSMEELQFGELSAASGRSRPTEHQGRSDCDEITNVLSQMKVTETKENKSFGCMH